jgi:hypothetical protein
VSVFGEHPVGAALRHCSRSHHLRRTLTTAAVVGVILTAINQLDVILTGEPTAATAVKTGLNFVVPFIVSNVGLLSGRAAASGNDPSAQDAETPGR